MGELLGGVFREAGFLDRSQTAACAGMAECLGR